MADITKLRVNGVDYQIRDAQASAYTDTATSALASAFDTKLEGKADKDKCPFLCYRREELLRRIEGTLAIGRECEEEHRRIKYLYENCIKNVSAR